MPLALSRLRFLIVAATAAAVPATLAFGQVKFETSVESLPERPAPETAFGPYASEPPVSEFKDRAIITSEGDILTESTGSIAFAPNRTKIQYNDVTIEGDRMVIDFVSEDVQVDGNVIFTTPTDFIRCTSGRFNLGAQQGVAYGVEGQSGDFFFKVLRDEEKKGPAFRQFDGRQVVFQDSYFTPNDFPVPMWYIRASEVIFVRDERVFFKNARIYVRGVPVFWMPFYTLNLRTGSPWSIVVGSDSDLGFYTRIGYRYRHYVQTPEFEKPEKLDMRSEGQLDTYVDLTTERGVGVGGRYEYQFDYRRHRGFMEVYGVRDLGRRIEEDPANEIDAEGDEEGASEGTNRWVYRHQHNSFFFNSLIFQWNADLASDPDVYQDYLDRFVVLSENRRGRLFEQRVRAAMTFRWDTAIGRIMVDRKHRLGQNRLTDYTDPFADDLDFDPDPNFLEEERFRGNGISGDRYGLVSENVSARYATRLLKVGSAPLYYRFEANAFNSLDSGFNTLFDDDDARVKGLDVYNSLTNRIRLGPRTTWTNTIGVGAAFYDRDSDELFSERDFGRYTPIAAEGEEVQLGVGEPARLEGDPEGTRIIDGVRVIDRNRYFLGGSNTERSLDETDSYYLFADYESRLNHRFSDFLDGYLRYFLRKGTSDSLGQFYESIGRVEAAGDIHDFYTDRHIIEGGLNFFLRYPNLVTRVVAGQNLQSEEDIYANELLRYATIVTDYINVTNEFTASAGVSYQQRQIRDRSDPNAFEQDSLSPFLRLAYFPLHARYWAALNVFGNVKLQEDPVIRDARQQLRFDEEDDEFIIEPTIGRRFGPKYRAQIGAQYNTRYEVFDSAGITIIRDLYDAELGLFLGVRNDTFRTRRDDTREDSLEERRSETNYETDIRVGLQFRINRDQPGLGSRSIVTLNDVKQNPKFVR